MNNIDPRLVKAGDTVTVEVIPLHGPRYSLGGEVYRVDTSGSLWVGPVSITAPDEDIVRVTLTAHQPAPEPEPEWKPGTAVSGTIWAGAKSKSEKRDVRLVRASNEEFPWYDPEEDDFYKDDVLTDVRPLVVLDPESDTDRLSNIIREVDGNHDLGAGGLAEAILQRLAR